MGGHGGGWRSFIRYDEEQDQPKVDRDLLGRVATYARPYWKWVAATLLTMIVISILSIIPPLLIRDLIDHAIPEGDIARITQLALAMIAIPLLNGLFGVIQRYANALVGESIIFDLRSQLYDHLQQMSLRFYTNTQVGEMMSRLNNDVVGAQRAVTGTVLTILSNFFTIFLTLFIMIRLDWRLTLVAVAILPLFILPARRVGETLRRIARESMELNARMNALMNETLNVSGALLVKLFGRRKYEVDRFRDRASGVRDIGVRQAVVGRWFFLSLSLVSAIGTALVFWLGGYLTVAGVFTIGTIVAFTAYLRDLYGPLTAMTNARVEFVTSMVSFERVFEVLDLPVEIMDQPDAIALDDVEGRVQFKNVSFSYQESQGGPVGLDELRRFTWGGHATYVPDPKKRSAELKIGHVPEETLRWALKNISFEIQPGQMAALVGPSGAGKTTVTYMLPRLYDPTEGSITLDGFDLREIELESLALHVGMVTQETFLFHTSIRENLLYARQDATQEELEEVCRAANIHEFIASLPDGYDTTVGERGYRLSGGEKQRVSIARVLLKNPRVLILDEATSHLDSQSEALIQEAMETVMEGRTTLVIAHRLSTVIDADLILVMSRSELVERGNHAELLSQGGLYADLYETQFNLPVTTE
ncbi:MAG: ABC transporter ATP-binding protein [Anaerolineales bacterium]